MSSVLIWDASVRGVGCLCSKTGGGPTGNQVPRGGRGPGALTMATGLGVVAGGWETGLPRPPPRRCGRGERLGLRETWGRGGSTRGGHTLARRPCVLVLSVCPPSLSLGDIGGSHGSPSLAHTGEVPPCPGPLAGSRTERFPGREWQSEGRARAGRAASQGRGLAGFSLRGHCPELCPRAKPRVWDRSSAQERGRETPQLTLPAHGCSSGRNSCSALALPRDQDGPTSAWVWGSGQPHVATCTCAVACSW